MLGRQIGTGANIFLGSRMLFNLLMQHQSYSRGHIINAVFTVTVTITDQLICPLL